MALSVRPLSSAWARVIKTVLAFCKGGDRPVGVHLPFIKVTGTDKTGPVFGPPPGGSEKQLNVAVYSTDSSGKPYGRVRLVPGRQSSPEMVGRAEEIQRLGQALERAA